MRNIKQNLFWALIYNVICIPVAAGALSFAGVTLNPMIAAAAMSCSSVCVVSNALRLRGWKPVVLGKVASALEPDTAPDAASGAGARKRGGCAHDGRALWRKTAMVRLFPLVIVKKCKS